MRDLTKSALTLPWAISMAGVQQLVNLVAPPPEGRIHGAKVALDEITRRAEHGLDGWLDEVLEAGDSLRRHILALTTTPPPTLDSSGLMRAATEPRLASLVQTTSDYGLLPAARLDVLRLPAEHRAAALQEFQNKLQVIQRFAQIRLDLNLDIADETPIARLLTRVAALPVASRLAGVEAVGTHAGTRALVESGGDPQDVLTDEATAALPSWSLIMLHAGVGSSFAQGVLATLTPDSSADRVRHAVTRFAALCRRSVRRGYEGAAVESLGMIARLLHHDLVPQLDREIESAEPDLRGYFWHGVGRALYLDPMALFPSLSERRSLFVTLRQEAPDDEAYGGAVSGASWAMTLVNLQRPGVMELFLRHHAVPSASHDAFASGVASAIVVQRDTVPDDTRVEPFVTHAPNTADVAAAWRSLVTAPCQNALERTNGELQQTCAPGLLFHYRPTQA